MARVPLSFTVRIRTDEDVLRLLTYRAVLREIAEGEPFDPTVQLAREALRQFGDEEAE